MGSIDRSWQEHLAAFLVVHGLSGGFYWCLNCNSGDTVCDRGSALETAYNLLFEICFYPTCVSPFSFHPFASSATITCVAT